MKWIEKDLGDLKTAYIYPIGDLHVGDPLFNEKKFKEFVNSIKSRDDTYLILMGDLLDCAIKDSIGDTYSAIQNPQQAKKYLIELLQPVKDKILGVIQGNHECFDPETEILTRTGWKTYDQLQEDECVATFNMNKKCIEYQQIIDKTVYDYNGEMYSINCDGCNLMITPNHNLYLAHNSSQCDWKLEQMQNIKLGNNRLVFRVAGEYAKQHEVPIEDDMLRLLAWIITDGCYSHQSVNSTSITIYQRESKSCMVENILKNLNVPYSKHIRDRDIKSICGKTLKSKEKEVSFTILASPIKDKILGLLPDKHKLPDWMYSMSDRQYKIFISALVDGDGSRHKSKPNTSWMLYGLKEILEQIQILSILHNQRATLSVYRKRQYRLNLAMNKAFVTIDRCINKIKKVPYNGIVWCVQVPNQTIVVRRKGKPVITGNSRIWKSSGVDISEDIAMALGCPYNREGLLLNVRLGHTLNPNNRQNYTIYAIHGIGAGRTVGSKANVMKRASDSVLANIYVIGHTHQPNVFPDVYYIPDVIHKKVVPMTRYYVNGGSFLDWGGYAESKMYSAVPIKTVTIVLSGTSKDYKCIV